jgi:hypothetical protein
LRRLRGRSRPRRTWGAIPVRAPSLPRPAWAAAMIGLVATFLFALLLSFLHLVRPPADRGPAAAMGPIVASRENFLRSSTAVLEASESAWPSFTHTTSAKDATSPVKTEERHPDVHRRSPRESGELEHVTQYLDNPDLRRIFLVSDVTDGATQRQVASVVEETTRFNYFKITIAQGIVIDPRHPGEATVFALVVSPTELKTLRSRLRTALQDRVEEAPVDPTVVTQLADIGQVQACPPAPVADVEIPRVALAIKAPNEGGDDEPAPPVDERIPDRQPTPEQERSSPAADLVGPPPLERPDRNVIVLVWVSSERPG